MMRLVLPVVLALAGLGGGVGAALALRPPPPEPQAEVAGPCGDVPPAVTRESEPETAGIRIGSNSEYVELGDQFVVPVVADGTVVALVVLTLSVEIAPGFESEILAHRPKLRDLFLRDLLDHANLGGFEGAFTANGTMDRLRTALRETGRHAMGSDLRDVLILDINRQELA